MDQQLIDTHTFLWLVNDDPRLSVRANEYINEVVLNDQSELLVSVMSLWEIAIKTNNKKLDLKMSFEEFVAKQQTQYLIKILPIELEHLFVASALPFPHANHKDPFDRLLISQSLSLGIPIINIGDKFDAYGV